MICEVNGVVLKVTSIAIKALIWGGGGMGGRDDTITISGQLIEDRDPELKEFEPTGRDHSITITKSCATSTLPKITISS